MNSYSRHLLSRDYLHHSHEDMYHEHQLDVDFVASKPHSLDAIEYMSDILSSDID